MRRSLLSVPLFTVLLTAPSGWGQTPTLARLQGEVDTLKATVAKLTRHIQVIESTAALNGLTGPHVIITGANVHIRSGSGVTHKGSTNTDGAWVDNPVGLGNLILGYNEPGPDDVTARGGSHNLVIGRDHQYPNSGGLVAGRDNAVSGRSASVSGGWRNTASGYVASVSGGQRNTASGWTASISGGVGKTDVTIPAGIGGNLKIDGGVGEVNISVAPEAAVRIEANSGLGQINLPAGLVRVSGSGSFIGTEGIWESADFADAKKQIHIHYHGGVGSFHLKFFEVL